MDSLTPERRSWNMFRIRSKNTKPEIRVRSLLHHMGYRFRLHQNNLPGKPDIVLPKYQTIVLVHGCFWHRHPGCRYAYTPKSRIEFWQNKFKENIDRDLKVQKELKDLGWRILVVWECELKDIEVLANKLDKFLSQDLKEE